MSAQQLSQLSRELVQAQNAGDIEEIERLEEEIHQIEEELAAGELDEYDERHGGRGWR